MSKPKLLALLLTALLILATAGLYTWQAVSRYFAIGPTSDWELAEINAPVATNPAPTAGSPAKASAKAGLPTAQKAGPSVYSGQEFLGYIKSVKKQFGNFYLGVDYVQWLTGDEAKKAALADGACKKLADCAPNGFYIRNVDKTIRIFQIYPLASVEMQSYSHRPDGSLNIGQTISLLDWLKIFVDESTSPFKNIPYSLTINKDNEVVRIIEKYTN
ncbi:MAG: hypothetical protein WCT37_04705 [Patescibacteria group bacterium]|jgi:hypothetical protein